jgi:phosphopantothenoylcysteine decarboxylase/phosphopantothenate--cysteine ligase
VQRIGVNTAAQMWEAVQGAIADQHVAICCAAVGDFRPRDAAVGKTKKEDLAKSPTLELEGTVDILAALGQQKKRPLLVGFAAETSADLDELATAKLKRKGCDLLVANNVAASDAGFEVDTNRAVFYQRNGASENHPLLYKRALAGKILDWVVGALS